MSDSPASDRGHPSSWPEDELEKECVFRRARHGGPGGQHRNKVETAVEVCHEPTGICAFAAERRSPEENRRVAIRRLRLRLAVALRCVNSPDVHPSALWTSRIQSQRIQCNEQHADFPALLAESLDAVQAKEFDVRRAAAALGCSTSQLVRFIGRVPEALEAVNRSRSARGLRPLRT